MIIKSKSGNFLSFNGCIYKKRDDAYQRLECYLPCATGTLNEPINVTAERWLSELESGNRKAKNAGVTKFIIDGEKLVTDGTFKKEKHK